MLILNIAGGKFEPLSIGKENRLIPRYTLNVDTSYFTKTTPDYIESEINQWLKDPDRISMSNNLNINIFEFMERTSLKFDRVTIYRFLEHVSFTQVEYFLYLISTITKKYSKVDVIVPNYNHLAQMILDENSYKNNPDFNFQSHNILLTTELLNQPPDPHASIWTPERIKYFWELENRFNVAETDPSFEFDGRSIYLRSIIERI